MLLIMMMMMVVLMIVAMMMMLMMVMAKMMMNTTGLTSGIEGRLDIHNSHMQPTDFGNRSGPKIFNPNKGGNAMRMALQGQSCWVLPYLGRVASARIDGRNVPSTLCLRRQDVPLPGASLRIAFRAQSAQG